MNDVTLKTHAVTVQELLWLDRVKKNSDMEALVELICARTTIEHERLLHMDLGDLTALLAKAVDSIEAAVQLGKLSQQFDTAGEHG